ncbi:taurine ABC transporter substrate-binding protein [Aliirhizobium smilacinae]|uniref:Taurine ABC transporter substrate-binding protein n=1 Tax=Aliirhizobium smilacinae TaxID=1395944 RepID=A0A5C4XEU0_9HYPH|nr:taurine ABC transporter substrate-binding protein [Rhizobium smilacinae]TNM61838.1 taurine ABC transporter substrate-binding protein [Rhizobium smilacinae]
MNIKTILKAAVFGIGSIVVAVSAQAADKKVVVAYQTDALPSSVAIANGEFSKDTGYEIDFRKFNSGAEIFAAIASGDVQVGYVGSSPFAAATSRGLAVKAFYLSSISGIDEALVVRNGSGIESLSDLKGKKLAAAPVSTDHYQLLALIKSLGLSERDVQVFAIPQPEIVAAFNRGDLDGGFVWDPALTELKKTGKVLVTSKEVAEKGAPTFSAWVAASKFGDENPEFLKKFAGVINKYYASFAKDKAAWNADSAHAKELAKLLGGTAEQQASALNNLNLLTPDVQASAAWLGGGEKSGAAKILKDTAQFLKDQGKVTEVLPSYAEFVTANALAGASN